MGGRGEIAEAKAALAARVVVLSVMHAFTA